jgi:APA family basic amino acid/polyamine antiporter
MTNALLRTKSVEQSLRDTEEPEFRLERVLGPIDLVVLGIGVTIGTGIFVLTGVVAATRAGPAVILSFLLAGLVCALAALCYAEFASSVPVAGSAYTFTYASLGELPAWIIGWDLLLEFAVAAAAVSIGCSQYLNTALASMGLALPRGIAGGPGATLDLGAGAIVLLLSGVAALGVGLSARVTRVVTMIKVGAVLFFLVLGARFVNPANWIPFVPPPAVSSGPGPAGSVLETPVLQLFLGGGSSPTSFGLGGIVTGAAIVFFAFLGFDLVATTAEETRRPQRDMPIGILGSLAVVTLLYMLVSLVLTGIAPYTELNTAAPMATALVSVGQAWAAGLVSAGAIAGLVAVILMLLVGQSRIGFAMSRDRLLPAWLAQVHPRYRTPYRMTLLTGSLVAVLAAVLPIGEIAELVNIGSLVAFMFVSLSILVLRRARPTLKRAFRTPLVPWVPLLAGLSCLYLMLNLPLVTWLRFVAWLAAGILIYAGYGFRHSRLATIED